MKDSSEKFAVECNIRRLESRGDAWGYDKSPVGVLYDAEVNVNKQLISTKVALAEHGMHSELIKTLHDKRLIDDNAYSQSSDVNYQSFDGPDSKRYKLYIISWEQDQLDFPIKGMWLAEQRSEVPDVHVYAELGLRALMLTTLKRHNINDGSTKLWTPEQLESVPSQNIEQLQVG